MQVISIMYTLSFLGIYLTAYLWGALWIRYICEASLTGMFWPLLIFTFVLIVIHIIRFFRKDSLLHSMVPVMYIVSLIVFLTGRRISWIALPVCLSCTLLFATLNVEILKIFKRRQRQKAMVPIRYIQNGFEITEDLKFMDRRLPWNYFK